jgi:hypothetical protein
MTPSLTKYTGVYNIIGRGIDAAPLTRNAVAEITKAVKVYKINSEMTIRNRKQRSKSQ